MVLEELQSKRNALEKKLDPRAHALYHKIANKISIRVAETKQIKGGAYGGYARYGFRNKRNDLDIIGPRHKNKKDNATILLSTKNSLSYTRRLHYLLHEIGHHYFYSQNDRNNIRIKPHLARQKAHNNKEFNTLNSEINAQWYKKHFFKRYGDNDFILYDYCLDINRIFQEINDIGAPWNTHPRPFWLTILAWLYALVTPISQSSIKEIEPRFEQEFLRNFHDKIAGFNKEADLLRPLELYSETIRRIQNNALLRAKIKTFLNMNKFGKECIDIPVKKPAKNNAPLF